jgi:hypothetical protein
LTRSRTIAAIHRGQTSRGVNCEEQWWTRHQKTQQVQRAKTAIAVKAVIVIMSHKACDAAGFVMQTGRVRAEERRYGGSWQPRNTRDPDSQHVPARYLDNCR